MKILMVLTSRDKLGDTGQKTGFWLEEFASPYYVFKDRNIDVTLASPKGGKPPLTQKVTRLTFRLRQQKGFARTMNLKNNSPIRIA
jgi:putative intracellular protease/amidase